MPAFALAMVGQRAGALSVWRAANAERGNAPSPRRIVRVREKLADGSACLVVGCELGHVIAMALAEPGREHHGAGAIRADLGHVSMVFVDPERWGRGVGSDLLDALHREMRARGWRTSSLWTRVGNERARRLYERRGYSITNNAKQLVGGDEILRYELRLDDGCATAESRDV